MRSPTAVTVALKLAAEEGLSIDADYGGIAYLRQESISFLLARYDVFVVKGPYMVDNFVAIGVEFNRIFCLYIPDIYERDDEKLVGILKEKSLAVVR